MYAKQNNWPLFLEYDNWQYYYKDGWHDYFTSLENFKGDAQYTEIKRYRHPMSDSLPKYSMREYSACIKEIFTLKDELKKRVEDFVASIGGEFTSLYIRGGDKSTEVPQITLDQILGGIDIKDDGRNIFVQTDDYTYVTKVQEAFPSCKIFTTTPEDKRGSTNRFMVGWTPEERKAETEELLVAVSIFVRCTKGWTYYLSNVGMFHKLFAYDKIEFYLQFDHTREYINEQYSLDAVRNPYNMLVHY